MSNPFADEEGNGWSATPASPPARNYNTTESGWSNITPERPDRDRPVRPLPSHSAAFAMPTGKTQREIELDAREAELFARERRIADREKTAGSMKVVGALTMFFNAITCLALLIVKADSAGSCFGIALATFLLGTPISLVFWFQSLYNGVKFDRSLSFMFFFLNYGIHLAAMAVFAIGIPGWGGAGIIYTLSALGSSVGVGVLCVINSGLLIFDVLYGTWQVKSVHTYWRSQGMTVQSAQNQAVSDVASSKIGQNIGQELGKAAIRNAASSS